MRVGNAGLTIWCCASVAETRIFARCLVATLVAKVCNAPCYYYSIGQTGTIRRTRMTTDSQDLSPDEVATLARMRREAAERAELLADGKGQAVPNPDTFAGPVGFPPLSVQDPPTPDRGREV